MGRHGEKKISDFTYESGAVRMKIPVMMVDGKQQRPTEIPGIAPHSCEAEKIGTYFRVKLEDPDIHQEDVDIDKLRARVFAALKDAVAIEWRDMLYVEFERPSQLPSVKDRKLHAGCEAAVHADGNLQVSMTLKWTAVQIAEVGKRRQKVHRAFYQIRETDLRMGKGLGEVVRGRGNQHVIEWRGTQDGWPETGATKPWRNWEPVSEWHALVPNTAANRSALLTIAEALERLSDQLAKLLNQPTAEQVLASVAEKGLAGLSGGLKLLPSPVSAQAFDAQNEKTWPRQLILKSGRLRGENNEQLPKCSPRQLRRYGYQQDRANPQLWFREQSTVAAVGSGEEDDPFVQ